MALMKKDPQISYPSLKTFHTRVFCFPATKEKDSRRRLPSDQCFSGQFICPSNSSLLTTPYVVPLELAH